jgi:hypothetical protein
MSTPVTFRQLIATLEQTEQGFTILPLQHGSRLVMTQRGGRLFGPFADGDDALPLCWINPALSTPTAFRTLIEAGAWNVGGERIWIAPEIQFHIRDRDDSGGTFALPPATDPGGYEMEQDAQQVWLHQEIALRAYNLASGLKRLRISRIVEAAADPLRNLSAIPAGLHYAGYAHSVTITDLNDAPIVSEAWNLVQLEAGGTLILPTVSDQVEASAYFGTLPAEAITARDRCVRVAITGKQQFKVGYQSACLTGRVGYYHEPASDRAYLLVRSFFNNPSALYSEEPPLMRGRNGHSVHVYNDDGALGGFGEMECNGQAIGGATRRHSSTDLFVMWTYQGSPSAVKDAARLILGATL